MKITKTLPPNNANIRPCDFPLGTVYVCYTLWECHEVSTEYQGSEIRQGAYLSEVELCVLLSRNTLDLKEGSVGAGVTLATFMTEYAPFAVESVNKRQI